MSSEQPEIHVTVGDVQLELEEPFEEFAIFTLTWQCGGIDLLVGEDWGGDANYVKWKWWAGSGDDYISGEVDTLPQAVEELRDACEELGKALDRRYNGEDE